MPQYKKFRHYCRLESDPRHHWITKEVCPICKNEIGFETYSIRWRGKYNHLTCWQEKYPEQAARDKATRKEI